MAHALDHLAARSPAESDTLEVVSGLLDAEIKRLGAVVTNLRGRGKARERAVHAVRIGTRRIGAVLSIAAGVARPEDTERLRRDLKRIRRAAGVVRDADVGLEMVADLLKRCAPQDRDAWRAVRSALREASDRGLNKLSKVARALDAKRLRKHARQIRECGTPGVTIAEAARRAIPVLAASLREAGRADLSVVAAVHQLRVKAKAVRYALNLFGGVLPNPTQAERVAGLLVELQRTLGTLSDADRLGLRLDALCEAKAGEAPTGIARLARAQKLRVRRLHRAALTMWAELSGRGLFRLLQSAGTEPPASPTRESAVPPDPIRPPGADLNGTHQRNGHAAGTRRTRLAAIDVGSNSIRLIVAEAQPDGTYRVLDDEKDMARLGRGLDATGRLDPGGIQRAATAITRMKRIAEGLGAHTIRAVATAAVREATNGRDLVKLVKQSSGLDLEVISAEQEASLAYTSVAGAFDLSLLTVAVVDIGGGSTEVVLSAGGAIEQVYLLPIGAVRLMERYGGPERCAGDRFKDLRRDLRSLLRERVGRPPLKPQLVIATGGTSTALGAVALQHGRSPGSPAPGAAVQGLEMKRSTAGRILRDLRGLDLDSRARVPGLSPERADIIVPGVAVLHALMKHLEVRRLRVHAGGIRDGLLLSMVRVLYPREPGSRAEAGPDPLRGIYRLARTCRFDQRHSEHVAGLAVALFDGLAAAIKPRPGWAADDARLVLRAAALVLDVGYLINYAQHHRHSYSLIRHSDLPGLTAREVELIALIARYHRGAEPKPKHDGFAALPEEDQTLVRVLAGIVRVAVGLDRAHRQLVHGVRVTLTGDGVRVLVRADAEPEVDLWAARRKSGLLARALSLEVEIASLPGAEQPRDATLTRRAGSSIG